MLPYALKLAFRTLKRNKVPFFINLIGLSIGFSSSILILLWVQNELSYDRFHDNFDTLYRVVTEVRGEKGISNAYPLATAINAEIPQVRGTVRIRSTGDEILFQVGDQKFDETAVLFVDSNFFKLFTFPLIKGAGETALAGPDRVVLSERMAAKFFGTEDPMGKDVRVGDDQFTVSGVINNVPDNSHLQFDILLPMAYRARTDDAISENHWDNLDFYTYVQLAPDVTQREIASVQEKMKAIFKRNTSSFESTFELQPMSEIHLYSDFTDDIDGKGSIQYVQIFSIAAGFILLVACINFVNLATAVSARRSKEIGIRKVAGAERSGLIRQFMTESVLVTFIALVFALAFVFLMVPAFNEMSGKKLNFTIDNFLLFSGLIVMFVFTSLASGIYPAYILSSFKPIAALKGNVRLAKRGGTLFRNVLVIAQFVVSIVLMASTIIIYNQLHFIQNRNLGYDRENLLYIPLKGELAKNVTALKGELARAANLNNYSVVSELPTDLGSGTRGVEWSGKNPDVWLPFSIMGVDERTHEVFKMNLISGRSFSVDYKGDTSNYVVNEAALHAMGMSIDSAVGQPLSVFGVQGIIIGVVSNFNFKSVRETVEPIIIRINPRYGYAVVKTQPGRVMESVDELKEIWTRLNPSYHFEYGFVDQDLARLYLSEYRMGKLFYAFAALAIFISCLGLAGLALFTSEQRTKEIGIRKTVGASIPVILALLSKDFVRLVMMAFAISTPLVWYGMNQWLEAFAYRVNIQWWIFAVAGGSALLIAVIVVSLQSLRIALMNPVKSLRTE